jgi:peptidoglycan/LPS O-acetylase OafA/YrhL
VTAPSQRNQSLDVLRCIAVLLVVGSHLPYYDAWAKIGWIGVDLFFVLSGFLISGLLFQEYKDTGALDVKRFLIRRGLKIYPSFYLLMVGATVLYSLNHATIPRKQLIASWFFLQNYFHEDKVYLILSHTWTLAVEEHFYLLLPVLLMLLMAVFSKRDPFRVIPLLFLAISAFCLAVRYFTLGPFQLAWKTHMRLDGLFAGVALGYLYHFRMPLFRKLTGHYALVLAALFCAPALLFNQPDRIVQTFGLTFLYVGFSFLVAWSVVRSPKTSLGRAMAKGAARIGFYSYSIYLWHTLVCDAFLFYPNLSLIRFWLYIATANVAGIAMAHLVEVPYLALRERLFPPVHESSRPYPDSRESHALPTVGATPA